MAIKTIKILGGGTIEYEEDEWDIVVGEPYQEIVKDGTVNHRLSALHNADKGWIFIAESQPPSGDDKVFAEEAPPDADPGRAIMRVASRCPMPKVLIDEVLKRVNP